jgi:ribosomal-protein-alanine N-acetyltransferase
VDRSSQSIHDRRSIAVRHVLPSDVPAIVSILKESREASMWTEQSLLESSSQGIAWVAELEGLTAGVLIGRLAADEFEILNMAVAKVFRRQGIATRLVTAALEDAWRNGAGRTYLDVRASNQAGRALYTKIGFQICGQRTNYYREPTEDAVLMVLHQTANDS